jgi:hypothetical protein
MANILDKSSSSQETADNLTFSIFVILTILGKQNGNKLI